MRKLVVIAAFAIGCAAYRPIEASGLRAAGGAQARAASPVPSPPNARMPAGSVPIITPAPPMFPMKKSEGGGGPPGPGSSSPIQGKLIIQPGSPVDPGMTALRFDANITQIGAPSKTWRLDVRRVHPTMTYAWQPGKMVNAPGYVQDVLGKPSPIPCSDADQNQICFQLRAQDAVGGGASVELGQTCLPVKSLPGPAQPEFVVHHPAVPGPGAVFRFSVKVPRSYCNSQFRVLHSPLQGGSWSTAWRSAQLPSPTLDFPETYPIPGSGGSPPVRQQARPTEKPCFLLESKATLPGFPGQGSNSTLDKWCYTGPLKVAESAPVALALPGGGSGAASTDAVRAGSGTAQTGPGQRELKPDLQLEYEAASRGWNAGQPSGAVVWVRNRGTADAGPTKIRFDKPGLPPTLVSVRALPAPKPGPPSQYPQPFGPSEAIVLTNELQLYRGGTVTADALNQVDEARETNNVIALPAPK